MKTLRYLNTVLTVIALLLTLNLYVQLTGTPAGAMVSTANEAHAAAEPKGVGSTAARQQAMVEALDSLNTSVSAINKTLTDGSVRVRVDSLPAGDE